MSKYAYEIGLLYRRSFRCLCMELDLTYKEEKGWLDSFFIVEGEDCKIRRLNCIIDDLKERNKGDSYEKF